MFELCCMPERGARWADLKQHSSQKRDPVTQVHTNDMLGTSAYAVHAGDDFRCR